MSNFKRQYSLPDYNSVTDDIDVYVSAWRKLAAPIEKSLGLTMSGFDPGFSFVKGNPQQPGNGISISLPVWFVRDLSKQLQAQNDKT